MRTVVVDHQGVLLRHEAGAMCVRSEDGVLQRVPLTQMDRLVVENEALISVNLIRQLAAEGVAIVITRGRSRASAALMSPLAGDARRRLRQAAAWLDAPTRMHFGRLVVRIRVASQIRLLRRWSGDAPQARYALFRAARLLARLSPRIEAAGSLPTLRGVEGVAARIHFGAMRHLLVPGLGFSGRRRRPPTDPVNAALSLGYTLLHARALEAVHRAGLDPSLGALHDLSHGRPSLACDLVEGERYRVESLVVDMFRRRTLEPHHFGRTGDACLLLKSGRSPFFASMEPVLHEAQKRVSKRIARLIRALPEVPA
jgi:CRISPR-associated protein Cas1